MVYQEVNLQNGQAMSGVEKMPPKVITVYPQESTIRIILDNHSAHVSKETMTYLASRPNRFVYVHSPKHGSWLDLIASAFSKMAITFLRHIRVSSREELKNRILKGF